MSEVFQISENQISGVSNVNSMSKSPFQGTNWLFEAYFGVQNPSMTHFHDLYHKTCAMQYMKENLSSTNEILGASSDNLMSKRAILGFEQLKIGYLKRVFVFQNQPLTYFHDLCYWNGTVRYVLGVLDLTKLDFGGLNSQFDVKKANFRGLIAKICYWRPNLVSNSQFQLLVP